MTTLSTFFVTTPTPALPQRSRRFSGIRHWSAELNCWSEEAEALSCLLDKGLLNCPPAEYETAFSLTRELEHFRQSTLPALLHDLRVYRHSGVAPVLDPDMKTLKKRLQTGRDVFFALKKRTLQLAPSFISLRIF